MNLENSLTMLHFLTHFHKLNTSSIGGGVVYSLPLTHTIISFTIDQHVSSKIHFVTILSGFGMIHKHEENVH